MINNSSYSRSNFWKTFLFYFWIYTLLVILWGAWVRISHSGNGCGNHWPLCEGNFIPSGTEHKTWIEYTHRLMSGAYGLIVLFIYFNLRKQEPLQLSWLNRSLLILMISEAFLGALLVKGQLVTENDSLTRLLVMSFHQLNSFLLTGVSFLLYLCFKERKIKFTDLKKYKKYFLFFLILPITGAIASLSTTLFPSISVWQGILDDFSNGNHLFVRLRALHPFLALFIATGFFLFFQNRNKNRIALEFLFALFVGVVTLLTLSPVYLKLAHLLIAHLLWARLIQLFASFPDSSSR